MKFTKDSLGKDIIVDKNLNNFQVIMEWEKPYMEMLINKLNPKGKVLEIGFGLGYSANEIQKYNIESHTIIEKDKNVLKRLKKWAIKQKNKVNIVEGYWQDVLFKLGKFDSIFYDDSPINLIDDNKILNIRHLILPVIAHQHVRVNAKFAAYSIGNIDEIRNNIKIKNCEIYLKKLNMNIPKQHCRFIRGNMVNILCIKFLKGSLVN